LRAARFLLTKAISRFLRKILTFLRIPRGL
jgi:hypothetical protein